MKTANNIMLAALTSLVISVAFAESLEEIELRQCLKPGPSPMDVKPTVVELKEGVWSGDLIPDKNVISLDGEWSMIRENSKDFKPIPYQVPGSVHCALWAAGMIPDPYFGLNDAKAESMSYRDWIVYRDFEVDEHIAGLSDLLLEFDGVCNGCRVYLNGKLLGPKHEGMFGGPVYNVGGKVKPGKNHLEVWLERIPEWSVVDGFGGNETWRSTVVFNCCYGWHYAQIPALGIWRSVRLRAVPPASIVDPFISTVSTDGTMDFYTGIRSRLKGGLVTLTGEIKPKDSDEPAQMFSTEINGANPPRDLRLRFKIKNPKLWWPNGCGEQNLYTMKLRLLSKNGALLDEKKFDFGIRTIEMRPAGKDGKSSPDKFNWKFVINGTELFMKGTGWCTMDALMRFTNERYDRFLGAAKRQNVNFIRAWGCGLVENDYFYDLCDKYGICVMQEWPTAWDSYSRQPPEVLEETVEYGVKRLRNRASLIMWCGGNEGWAPLEDIEYKVDNLNMIGRRTIELDGTRPWHRQENWVRGSKHEYCSSWGLKNISYLITTEDDFLGEFGIDCFPNVESIKRYTPKEEWDELERTKGTPEWHIDPKGAVLHHTPKFGEGEGEATDLRRLTQHVWMFLPSNSLENVVLGSQIAQAVGDRHTLERARTRFPACGGACMYKLNDVYPAASWATVDWYGAEKYGSFVVSDALAPLTAIAKFDRLKSEGKPLELPFFIVDDGDALAKAGSWKASLRAYDEKLGEIRWLDAEGKGSVNRLRNLGTLKLSTEEAANAPLWIVADVTVDGKLAGRNFYFFNFENKQGCLFEAPKTKVEMKKEGKVCIFRNRGECAAINVHFVCHPGKSFTFTPEDNYFWLEPGEEKCVEVDDPDAIERIAWWNEPPVEIPMQGVPAGCDGKVMSDEYWRLWNTEEQAKIDADIEKYRKADGEFKFAAAAGASVHVEQLDHAFRFGGRGFRIGRQATEKINRNLEENFCKLFNQVTIAFYWRTFEMEEGKPHFKTLPADLESAFTSGEKEKMSLREQYHASPARSTEQFLEFAKKHGMSVHGHPLVWQSYEWAIPFWVYEKYCPEEEKAFLKLPLKDPATDERTYGGSDWCWEYKKRMMELKEKYTEEEISAKCPVYVANLKRLWKKRVAEILDYCGDRVDSWDVVNESVNDWRDPDEPQVLFQKSWYGLVPGGYVFDAFKTAAEHASAYPKLGINDNNSWAKYADEVKGLLKHGARVELIGAQFHIFKDEQFRKLVAGEKDIEFPSEITPTAIREQFDLLGQFGIPVHLSEITIPAPGRTDRARQQQAIASRNYYRLWFSQKSCYGITWWHGMEWSGYYGGSESSTAGYLDEEGNPKPLFFALDELINREWHTSLDVKADKDGKVAFRGFRGRYRLSWKDSAGRERTETVELK